MKGKSYATKLFLVAGFFALVILHGVMLFPGLEHLIYNKDDAAWFTTMALNIANHGRYTVDTFYRPDYGHHATWPPGFPLYLSVVIWAFGASWVALKVSMITLALGGLLAIHYALSGGAQADRKYALWATVVVALSPMYFLFSAVTMSEIPTIVLSYLCLGLLLRVESSRDALILGLAISAAFLTRGYAIALVPAACIHLVFMVSKRAILARVVLLAMCLGPVVITVVGWFLFTEYVSSTFPLDEISQRFGSGASGTVGNADPGLLRAAYWFHLRNPVHVLLPIVGLEFLGNDLVAGLGIVLAAVLVWGGYRAVRAGQIALVVWFACSLIIHVKFNQQSARYWLTYLPCMAYLTMWAFNSCRFNVGGACVALLLALVNVVMLAVHVSAPEEQRFISPYWKEHAELAIRIRDFLPDDALVLTSSSHNFYAATGIEAARFEESDEVLEQIGKERSLFRLCPLPGAEASVHAGGVSCALPTGRWQTRRVFSGTSLKLEALLPISTLTADKASRDN